MSSTVLLVFHAAHARWVEWRDIRLEREGDKTFPELAIISSLVYLED